MDRGAEDIEAKFRHRLPMFMRGNALARYDRFNESAMGALLGASRLVLDDIGTEYLDERGAYLSLLDELIDVRYSQELPIVITTNLTAPEFKGRYGSRIARRIRECGAFAALKDGAFVTANGDAHAHYC